MSLRPGRSGDADDAAGAYHSRSPSTGRGLSWAWGCGDDAPVDLVARRVDDRGHQARLAAGLGRIVDRQ